MNAGEKKSGMGVGMKVFLGVLLAGIVLIILVCGGLFWFGRQAVKMTENPAEVQQIVDSIVKIDIPEGYEPSSGMSMSLGMSMKMATYHRESPGEGTGGQLVLMQMKIPGQASDDQMKQSFDQQMRAQGHNEAISIKSTEMRSFDIDGQARDFEFAEGMNTQTNKPIRRVTGTFPGREGFVFLTLIEDDDAWNEEQAVKMLESISAK